MQISFINVTYAHYFNTSAILLLSDCGKGSVGFEFRCDWGDFTSTAHGKPPELWATPVASRDYEVLKITSYYSPTYSLYAYSLSLSLSLYEPFRWSQLHHNPWHTYNHIHLTRCNSLEQQQNRHTLDMRIASLSLPAWAFSRGGLNSPGSPPVSG